ncbi:hypothetical protein J2S74_002893 [Evansella vedderi]|uniref:Uncharacterized protein n=1 Tax=Evansella vedderi TaxID=38282 RepID=A0ABT9ZWA4_9BACI|nr:hypothetical protein [Evansella vedderi]MDQ0255511.1 hypothetical protein [Evansella vedderi]
MKNSKQLEQTDLVGKEFWGILMFELNLPALHKFLGLEKHFVGLIRFSDYVLFPEKIPPDHLEDFSFLLQNRHESDYYEELKGYKMDEDEERTHCLISELLQLKYGSGAIHSSSFHHFYQLPMNAFYSISLQLVEKGYISAYKMLECYQIYNAKGVDDDNKN